MSIPSYRDHRPKGRKIYSIPKPARRELLESLDRLILAEQPAVVEQASYDVLYIPKTAPALQPAEFSFTEGPTEIEIGE